MLTFPPGLSLDERIAHRRLRRLAQATAELIDTALEMERPLPLPPERIVELERSGFVVDLVTGAVTPLPPES